MANILTFDKICDVIACTHINEIVSNDNLEGLWNVA